MHSPLQLWRWPYSTADFHSGRSIFLHTTHESHILLDSSVRAEPRFTVKELVCAPASCTEASAAPLPVPALHNGQVPCSPCDMSPRCHHQTCRDRNGTAHGSVLWSQSLTAKGERISSSCVWIEKWNLNPARSLSRLWSQPVVRGWDL